jgi:hypothetical protein
VICGFHVTAGEVEKFPVSRMIRFLHALDMGADCRVLLAKKFGEKVFLLRRADNEDGAGVGEPLGDVLEERLVLPILSPVCSSRE